MRHAAFLSMMLLALLSGCRSKEREREDTRKKQQEILRQQSSKWTEEQKKFRFPDLGKKPQQKKSEQKGDGK